MPWTKIQSFSDSSHYSSSTNPSTSITLGSAVAVGDTVCATTGAGGNSSSWASTLADQLGNSWTRITSGQGGVLYDSTNNESEDYWLCIITHAGTPTITYTPDPGNSHNFLLIQGDHFTGSDSSSTRRASNGAFQSNPGTGTGVISSGSVAANNGDLLWGSSGDPASGPTTTEVIGTGFSAGHTLDTAIGCLTEWKTATGSEACTFTDATNGGSQNFFTAGIAVTPAGGGVTFQPDEDYWTGPLPMPLEPVVSIWGG
jgi:hypothetical protein